MNLTNVQKKDVSFRTDLLVGCFKSNTSFSLNFKYFMDQNAQCDQQLFYEKCVFKHVIDCLFFRLLEIDAINDVRCDFHSHTGYFGYNYRAFMYSQ